MVGAGRAAPGAEGMEARRPWFGRSSERPGVPAATAGAVCAARWRLRGRGPACARRQRKAAPPAGPSRGLCRRRRPDAPVPILQAARRAAARRVPEQQRVGLERVTWGALGVSVAGGSGRVKRRECRGQKQMPPASDGSHAAVFRSRKSQVARAAHSPHASAAGAATAKRYPRRWPRRRSCSG